MFLWVFLRTRLCMYGTCLIILSVFLHIFLSYGCCWGFKLIAMEGLFLLLYSAMLFIQYNSKGINSLQRTSLKELRYHVVLTLRTLLPRRALPSGTLQSDFLWIPDSVQMLLFREEDHPCIEPSPFPVLTVFLLLPPSTFTSTTVSSGAHFCHPQGLQS